MNEEQIFQAAAELPAAERAAFLATACDGQPALRQRVEGLLASHDDGGFMRRSADRTVSADLDSELARLKPEAGEDRIGQYKLLQKIGEGGFGTVWMAEQLEPVRRRVALKIIKLGMDTKEVIVRFEQERQALALMEHPNIAKVLDAGVTPLGRPFFVMELVRGIRITDFCDQNNLPTAERLDLFIAVCNAIQHAHQKGIIHRDIKPSNILVTLHDGVPVPKVIDFGVAKAIQSQRLTDLTFFTRFDQMIGTPLYMSPEQAEMSGLDIDTRSDIYSLGVLLYELLTGQTPFDAKELMALGMDAMRKTIREKEPVRPSTRLTQALAAAGVTRRTSGGAGESASSRRLLQIKELVHQLKGDLDWIVMKALEKDRSRRYETANGFALDIQRYLQSEPVVARPPTPLYRFQKAVRRNQLLFAAAGAVVAALLVGLFIASWQAIRATNAEQIVRRNAYAAEINVAFHALADNNLGKARDLLDRQRPKGDETDLRGFEWRYLWQLCQGDEFATFRDVGARGAAAAFSPDGKLLVYSGEKIMVRDAASLRLVATLSEPAETLSFARQTNLLATGSASGVKIWDTKTWEAVRSLPEAIQPALFSPDGRWLLTGMPGGFQLWDTYTWNSVDVSQDAPGLRWQTRHAMAFSPDSQFFVTISGQGLKWGGHLRVWRLPGLTELPEIRFESEPIAVAFTMDGKHLVAGLWDGQVVVLDFTTRQVKATLKEHTANVTVIAVGSDGKTFATVSVDQSINLWDATTFKHLVRLRGNVGRTWCLAISPDGGTVLSSNMEGTTRLWRTEKRHLPTLLEGAGLMAGFSGDGGKVVVGASNGWCVWTPPSGERVDIPVSTVSPVVDMGRPYDVEPDEFIGALGRINGTVELWNLHGRAKITEWAAHDDGISAVTFSPDGKRLATGTTNGEVKIWDLASRRELVGFEPVGCHFFCLAFSPDGKTLAGSGRSSTVWLWDVWTGRELRQLSGHVSIVGQVSFSPDGTLLATGSFSGEVRLWELPSGAELPPLKDHGISVVGVAFSPDGKTLATGDGHKLILWNVATRQELATIPILGKFPTLSFSPDGRMLVLGERPETEGQIQVLRVPTFDEIATAEAKRDQSGNPAR